MWIICLADDSYEMSNLIAQLWKCGAILDLPCPSIILSLWFCRSVLLSFCHSVTSSDDNFPKACHKAVFPRSWYIFHVWFGQVLFKFDNKVLPWWMILMVSLLLQFIEGTYHLVTILPGLYVEIFLYILTDTKEDWVSEDCIYSKYLDGDAWVNSVGLSQIAPLGIVCSGPTLFAFCFFCFDGSQISKILF